jgi:hypothetical protein
MTPTGQCWVSTSRASSPRRGVASRRTARATGAAGRCALAGCPRLGPIADRGAGYGIITCASVVAWPTTLVQPGTVTRPIAAPNRFAARHVHAPKRGAGTRHVVEHHRDHETSDLIGYSGPDPGDPLTVPAGSIAAFSSTLFHRTGPNTSGHPRRVYIAQYRAQIADLFAS